MDLRPILDNGGCIDRLYIRETIKDNSGDVQSDLVLKLRELGYKVCFSGTVVRYTMLNGSSKSDFDAESLETLFPLREVFGRVEIVGYEPIDWASIESIDERVDLYLALGQQLGELSFDYVSQNWTTPDGYVIINAVDSFNKIGVDKASLINDSWKRFRKGDTTEWSYLDMRAICRNLRESVCIDNIFRRLNRYARDQYHSREGIKSLLRVNDPAVAHEPETRELLHRHGVGLCGNDGQEALQLDDLAIPGGQYAKAAGITFVGMNVLRDYLVDERWYTTLGLTSPPTVSEVEIALRRQLGVPNSQPAIIWVGHLGAEGAIPETEYQPVFHLDMFFHPFGFDASGDYIFGMSELIDYHHDERTLSTDYYCTLKADLDRSFERISAELTGLSIRYKGIRVPMLTFECHRKKFVITFLNGISSRVNEAGIEFLMPDYQSTFCRGTLTYDYMGARILAQEKLESVGVKVILVQDDYGDDHGLRCRVRVISRN